MLKTFPLSVDNPMTVAELCQRVGHCQLDTRSESLIIQSVASPESAIKGSIIFFSKDRRITEPVVLNSNASIFVIAENISIPVPKNKCIIRTVDPLAWFIHAIQELIKSDDASTAHDERPIHESVCFGGNVSVGYGTVIEKGCFIGSNSRIDSGCFIGRNTRIGEHVFIQSGARIGGVGLGYKKGFNGERLFFPHLGAVCIGDDVVIGANSVVVRGQLSDTVLNDSVRLGNLVNIGHNSTIGRRSVISSGACIAGGVTIGEDCNIGAGVMINAKVTIGDKALIGLGSVVTKSTPALSRLFGNPAKTLPTLRQF